ncbi:MAG: hypothetical protein WCL39_08550, partial [Armatimonadota bacterium]
RETGAAKGAEVEAVGMARAKAFKEQVSALGEGPTMLVNIITALAERGIKIVPDILVAGGGGGTGGSMDGVAASVMQYLKGISSDKPSADA